MRGPKFEGLMEWTARQSGVTEKLPKRLLSNGNVYDDQVVCQTMEVASSKNPSFALI